MAVKYDLMVGNGSYQKEGQTKTSWLKIGRVLEKANGGFAMKLDCIPTSSVDRDGNTQAWDGWVQMFEPQPREGGSTQVNNQPAPSRASPQAQPVDDGFDSIPF